MPKRQADLHFGRSYPGAESKGAHDDYASATCGGFFPNPVACSNA